MKDDCPDSCEINMLKDFGGGVKVVSDFALIYLFDADGSQAIVIRRIRATYPLKETPKPPAKVLLTKPRSSKRPI